MMVSIIIPLFHGKKYLEQILSQVEECARRIDKVSVELILYNDFPGEKICVPQMEYPYKIKVYDPGFNSGIHGARVRGLGYAKGGYVLFLDQDDRISPLYLEKQLECIGDADAVVCRAIHNGRLHYTDTHVFEKVISKEFMVKKWCPIVSPGQVLIKRGSIPLLWTKHILKNNGADDYFLWLSMMGEGKVFALNQAVLFEHVTTGVNVSSDTNKMMDSEEEMIEILKEERVFRGKDEISLLGLARSLRRIHIKELDDQKRTLDFIQRWNIGMACGNPPLDFLKRNDIRKLAIYGAGVLGKNIELLLHDTEVEVAFYIDQNARYILSTLPVYKKEILKKRKELCKEIDAILVTINDKTLIEEMADLTGRPVYGINDIWE